MAENSVEHTDQKVKRFKEPVMAVSAGVAAALVVVTLPHVYLESVIGATGLSEMVPAAAPPLGNTARGLIAIMAGLVSASAIYYFLNRKGGSDMGVALREQINAASPIEIDLNAEAEAKKSRFSLPKFDAKSLTKFLKKPKKDKARVMDLADLPQLRKVDDEADAPARPPIFAEPAPTAPPPLAEAIQAFEEAAPAQPMSAEQPAEAPLEMTADMPLEMTADMTAELQVETPALPSETQAYSDVIPPLVSAPDGPQPEPAPVAEMPAEDLSGLNIAQLADRLESGLRRLKQLEAGSAVAAELSTGSAPLAPSVPPSAPPSEAPSAVSEPHTPVAPPMAVAEPFASPTLAGPISEAPVMAPPQLKEVEKSPEDIAAVRQADMDAALKAALGTLEKMTAQR